MKEEKNLVLKKLTFKSADGQWVSISETPGAVEVLLTIQNMKGEMETARLTREQFDLLMSMKYSFAFSEDEQERER